MSKSGSKSPRDVVAKHLRDVPRSGIREFFDIVSTRSDVISLGIGEPDFATPWHIREAAMYALDHGATHYTSNRGLDSLRREISGYVRGAFGAAYDPETEILITVGVSEAVDLALRTVLNPGEEVLIHEPSYVCYGPLTTMAHGAAVPVPTRAEDGFRLNRALLEARVTDRTRAILMNFPTNPTGATLTRDDVEGIAALARERDLLVIADEIYSELTYEGERVSIAAQPGMKERTIFLHGFSKAWAMTGFRVGYACGPAAIIEGMTKIHQYSMLCAPILGQKAAVEALRNHRGDVEAMRASYLERRNFLCGALNDMGLRCHRPRGAFYLFPYIGGFGLPSKEFALRLLDERQVACVPGTAFGASGEGYLRCSYATDLDEIKEAARRLESFVKTLPRAAQT